MSKVRTFGSGANRGSEKGKLDYEGFLSPLVLRRYAEYLHGHRYLEDGETRASDNWQRGIPITSYMKSLWRHLMTLWSGHRGWTEDDIEDALCGIIFNASGYLHEILKKKLIQRDDDEWLDRLWQMDELVDKPTSPDV